MQVTNAVVYAYDCTFNNNTAWEGGGIGIAGDYGVLTLDSCRVMYNSLAMSYDGGGILMWSMGRLVAVNTNITYNRARHGMYIY